MPVSKNMQQIPGKNFSFLMRLRIVLDQAGQPILRGSLRRIGTTQVQYFASLDAVVKIVQEMVAAAPGAEKQPDK